MKKNPTDEERILDDINEFFVGDVLNEQKKATLDRVRVLCREIAESEPQIKARMYPFTNDSNNGSASLIFPNVLFCTNTAVVKKMAELYSLADAFVTTTLQGTLKLTFLVHDMWSEFHYEEE